MQLDEFKSVVKVYTGDAADHLRKTYINKFIETKKENYKKYIETLHNFSDGLCYTGYLWDYLKTPVAINYSYFELNVKLKDVYVLWDIHTKERILIKDYWKFNKTSVLKMKFVELLCNLKYVPEDIYVFDDTLDWTIILTHEYVDDKRWCLKSGTI